MGTEVLQSHDFLRSPFPGRGFPPRSGRRSRRDGPCGVVAPTKAPDHLVMGQVTILKRGEALLKKPSVSDRCSPDLAEKKKAVKATLGSTGGRRQQSKETACGQLKKKGFVADKESVLPSTGRMRREPDLVPKQVPADVSFSGSVSFISPSPSDLPFPFSFARKDPNGNYSSEDLRRLLRI